MTGSHDIVKTLTERDQHDHDANYLKTDSAEWQRGNFNQRSYKYKRQKYFVGSTP